MNLLKLKGQDQLRTRILVQMGGDLLMGNICTGKKANIKIERII